MFTYIFLFYEPITLQDLSQLIILSRESEWSSNQSIHLINRASRRDALVKHYSDVHQMTPRGGDVANNVVVDGIFDLWREGRDYKCTYIQVDLAMGQSARRHHKWHNCQWLVCSIWLLTLGNGISIYQCRDPKEWRLPKKGKPWAITMSCI